MVAKPYVKYRAKNFLQALFPVLGAIAGAATGMLLAKYLAKAHSKEGINATRILKKAESLYRIMQQLP